ncbi:MAG: hypothetical protein V4549_07725 [Bacteroidota bacterium]
MNSKLYYIAYKFLKLRATKNGMQAFSALPANDNDRSKVIQFLKYNHQVKFI